MGLPPAQEKGSRSGRTKKRSGAADLEIQKGSLNGGAKLAGFGGSLSTVLSIVPSSVALAKEEGPAKVEGQAKADSLSRGSQSRQVLATGLGNGANRGKRGGRDFLSLSLKGPACLL
jgi:hypothetical protein